MSHTRILENLQDWALIIEIVERKSISAVAYSMGIERSQLSRVVRSMEQALGYKLFERSGRVIVPTQAALEAARRIGPVVQAMHEAIAELRVSGAAEEGSIRFGAMPGFMQKQNARRLAFSENVRRLCSFCAASPAWRPIRT